MLIGNSERQRVAVEVKSIGAEIPENRLFRPETEPALESFRLDEADFA